MKFRLYSIFLNPLDFPPSRSRRRRRPNKRVDNYVVRGGTVIQGDFCPDEEPTAVVHSLDAARAAVPPGLVLMARHPQEHSSLVETWL